MKADQEENEDAMFEQIMNKIGSRGKFQKRFNYLFNMFFVMLASMPYYNFVLAMAVPDHWCHVPGRNGTNYTLDQWKEITLPRGRPDWSELSEPEQSSLQALGNIIVCWFIDRTGASARAGTIVNMVGSTTRPGTQRQHLPEKTGCVTDELYVTNLYSFSRGGDVIGTFLMGQLGDMIGRRPVFFISIALLAAGRLISALTSGMYYVFLAVTVLSSIPVTAVFQAPLILGIEISASEERSLIALLQCIGWTAGLCTMPLVFWALSGDWSLFIIVTTIPSALFLFTCKWFPESPRWLAATGRVAKCEKALGKIAQMNETTLPPDTAEILLTLSKKKEKSYGFASLFSSWRLAKNTFLIAAVGSLGNLVYFTLMLNVNTMSGNPFMNFFWQSLVELLGFILGKYFSEKLGRRWTHVIAFMFMSGAHIFIILLVNKPELNWLLLTMVVVVKFFTTLSGYTGYLQSMETFPTCVRQTGCSLASSAASIVGTLGPYILYLGSVTDKRYAYAIMGLATILGAIASFFLPETMNQKLPETLADAAVFGKDQKYWALYQESNIPFDGTDSTASGASPSASLVSTASIFSGRPLSEECDHRAADSVSRL
uniref:Major facilitator superfamily (MFS) profile domain-containing protein n=2 Tax=Timema TaxID=61471 RepID=A0A7R8VLV3_TIMDO|nr:unnamed protein product [Timema douglasi]